MFVNLLSNMYQTISMAEDEYQPVTQMESPSPEGSLFTPPVTCLLGNVASESCIPALHNVRVCMRWIIRRP